VARALATAQQCPCGSLRATQHPEHARLSSPPDPDLDPGDLSVNAHALVVIAYAVLVIAQLLVATAQLLGEPSRTSCEATQLLGEPSRTSGEAAQPLSEPSGTSFEALRLAGILAEDRLRVGPALVVVGEAEFVGVLLRKAPRRLVKAERRRERSEVTYLECEVDAATCLALPAPQDAERERQVAMDVQPGSSTGTVTPHSPRSDP
jgi:hypothetical protein